MYEDNFYVLSGRIMYHRLGLPSLPTRKRIVDKYKSFVDSAGGPESFKSPDEAIEKFLKQNKKDFYV